MGKASNLQQDCAFHLEFGQNAGNLLPACNITLTWPFIVYLNSGKLTRTLISHEHVKHVLPKPAELNLDKLSSKTVNTKNYTWLHPENGPNGESLQ